MNPSPAHELLKALPFLVKDTSALNQRDFLRLSRFGGIQKGILTEVSGALGSGKTEGVLRLLPENPTLRVAWVERQWSLFPLAIESGLRKNFWCVELAQCPSSALSMLLPIVSSQVFGAVVLNCEFDEKKSEIELRRLQIAAEKSNVAVVLLVERPLSRGAWCIRNRFEVRRNGKELEVLKNNFSPLVAEHA